MKKKKNVLSIVMYVFAVIALGYTVYAAFQAYTTFTNYYSGSTLNVINLVMYMFSTAFEALCFSAVFYGLGVVGDMLFKLTSTQEPKEQKTESNEEKPAEK
jgi:hypothetical protein